ncbi:LiaI-LiaF-like domain-containing protein [Pseudalkalibacillus caeni]|uniref:LiaI-LiaF-like transmembrane region domain-containing protein n=1 Tax=Exobacillus caeni TaxID=2574798 RepID=A0A5R9FF53_9BACL|nr:DUF5668 domain-containing protein [Pseudalkalibacillus caeni]TLS39214.1 hypothetical protein FCL54_02590 [Pseudalkalibacillus caeni]
MKKQGVFLGILLIGIGSFFLLENFNVPYMDQLASWPLILIIIGFAFLFQAFLVKEYQNIFPGIILIGLGVHFFALNSLPFWPNSWGMYTLIVSLAFLFTYYKTKKGGLFTGMALLIISLFELLYTGFQLWLQTTFNFIGELWPIILIAFGIYLIWFKKK